MFDSQPQSAQSIKAFWNCRDECHEALSNRVREQGEGSVDSRSVTMLTDCIAICQIMAEFITRQSPMRYAVATACAAICKECADCCEALSGAEMMRCAETCNQSAILAGKFA